MASFWCGRYELQEVMHRAKGLHDWSAQLVIQILKTLAWPLFAQTHSVSAIAFALTLASQHSTRKPEVSRGMSGELEAIASSCGRLE